MRIARRNWTLAGVWLVLLCFSWTLHTPGSKASGREIGRLFPNFQAEHAARVLIERSVEGTAGAGAGTRSIEIVRREVEEGGSLWVLPGSFDHPAGSVSLQQLFDAVTSLTNLDLLAEDTGSHGDYGVGEEGLMVRIFDEAGERLAGFVQGGEATTGAGLATYVRPLGSDEVYRAPRVGAIPVDPYRWLERHWLSFQPALVREVRVTEADSTQVWTRADAERWTRDEKPVSARLMRSLLDRLAALFFDEVLAARAGDASAEIEIVLVLHDASEVSFYFAKADPEGSRQAWRGPEDPVVRFSATASALLTKALRALRGGL